VTQIRRYEDGVQGKRMRGNCRIKILDAPCCPS
jgi:hypothetical protein